ncbi:MAG: vWA domain-containing protein [Pyrinomonadaceae bacterium]
MQVPGRRNHLRRARGVAYTLLLLLSVGVAALVSPSAHAARRDFTGLDVVILIDQSGSMWGRLPNDRWGHRIGQAKNIIYRLAEHVEHTDFVHRVSVVDFGDKAAPAFPNVLVLRYDPKDPGAALRDARLVVERFVTAKALVNTNTPEGLEVGLKELERTGAAEPRDGRRRIVLLITDGRPDLPGSGADLAELRNRVERQADALKAAGAELWVVGLNDASNYWNAGDGEFWERTAGKGRARLAETASTNISTLVEEFVNEWLGVAGTTVGREYECPPYLRRIIFNINFGLPRSPVRVLDPAGREVPVSSGGVSSTPGTFARFIVDDPAPGTYKIDQDPSRSYTSFVETFSPNIKRLAPAAATSAAAEARIVFQATDAQGRPLEPLPAWPINSKVVVTLPSGSSEEIPAAYAGEGKFVAKWKPPAVGRYQVRLKGLVTLAGGPTFDVFGSDAHSYDEQLEVNDLRPYYLQMVEPDPTGSLRVLPWQAESRLEFALIDAKREPVPDPALVVKDPATWLTLQLIDKSGVPLAAPVPLRPNAAGRFEAAVPVALDWRGGEGWWRSGRMDVRVNAEPERMDAGQFLDSVALPEEAESMRVGDDPMTVGPVSVHFSWLFLGAALALLLCLIVAAALFLMRKTVPNLLLWWADTSRRRFVELKIYDGNTDPAGDDAKKYPAGRAHHFNYDRQVSVSVGGQDFVATLFRVKRMLTPDDVKAEVEYAWLNDPQRKTYKSLISKGRVERLKGLPGGGYLLRLDVKT